MADQFELKQVFETPDGAKFATKKEAVEHMRRPAIKQALAQVIEGNEELVDWLIDNREEIADAFSTGTIRRVSKSDRAGLEKALNAAVELNEPKLKFLVDNKDDILNGFRWPSVKRMDDAEKAAAVKETLTGLAENNEEVADFVIENKDAILASFDAGKVKKEINPKAREGLARYQAEQKRLKEEREAAGGESAPEEEAPATTDKPAAPKSKK